MAANVIHAESIRPADQQVHVAAPARHRFLFLDALRGLAAFFIVFWHIPFQLQPKIAPGGNQWLAVDFFFCLSGFVIAFSYEKRLSETFSLRDFLVARIIRLYPIYLLGMVLGLFVEIGIHTAAHKTQDGVPWLLFLFLISLVMLPTKLAGVPNRTDFPLNSPAWSLFLEMVANIAYALMVRLRIAQTAILALVAAVSLALLSASVFHGHTVDVGFYDATFALGFARVAFSFFVGVLLFRLYRHRAKTAAGPTHFGNVTAVLLSLLLALLLLAPWQPMRSEFARLAFVIFCFPAIVFLGARVRIPHTLTRFCTVLGELSYPLYLLHKPIISLLYARRVLTFATVHPTIAAIGIPCLIALAACAAWAFGEHVDLPLRRRLARRYNRLTGVATAKPQRTQS